MTNILKGRPAADPEEQGCEAPTLREQKKADKRSRILATAGRLFTERGYEAVTTAELARQAGVGVGTLFRYAGSKSELLVTILNERLKDGARVGLQMAREGASPVWALMAVFDPLIEECRSHTANAMAYVREVLFGSGPGGKRAVDQLTEMETTVVQVLQCAQGLCPPDLSLDALGMQKLAHAVVGTVYLDVVRACREPELMAGLTDRVLGSLTYLLRPVPVRSGPPVAAPAVPAAV